MIDVLQCLPTILQTAVSSDNMDTYFTNVGFGEYPADSSIES